MVRLTKRLLLATMIVVVPVAAIAYWLASPLFINVVVAEAAPTQPKVLLLGSFANADDFHTAEGAAKVVQTGTERVLRLENFKVRNGPDLFVYLSVERDVSKGFVDLGRLKGNIGDQNYNIPPDTDFSKYKVLVIWCRAFTTPFGYAELRTS